MSADPVMAWMQRMDAYGPIDPVTLMEYAMDAVLAVAVKTGKTTGEVLKGVGETPEDPVARGLAERRYREKGWIK